MTSVKVAVRVRPFNERENDSSTIIEMDGKRTRIYDPKVKSPGTSGNSGREELRVREFIFDHSFWSARPSDLHFVTQRQVYEALGPGVVSTVYEGFNVCVFAYGQTGSGKTYTMMGSQDNPGFIPRFCEALFGKMTDPDTTFRVQVSFLEIYNENVRDLLKKGDSQDKLKIREHPSDGPYVQGLSQHTVVSYEGIVQLMIKGSSNRVTATTLMNDTSSRSHAIFTVTFTQAKFQDGLPSERQSKINLVDLAGSERANASGSTGLRLKEGGNINKSLVTLGNVISALAELAEKSGPQRKPAFIPYRDSKLTYLLKDSLGGNAKTIMIATISPSELNYGESLSTLRYADRAKSILNKPIVNEDANVRLIRVLRREVAHLKAQLASMDGAVIPCVHEKLNEKEAKVKLLTDEWTDKWRRAAAILQEQQNLELRKSGVGVILDSSLPHLVCVDDDVLSTGVMLYHLKEGLTKIGTEDSKETQDISISGENAHPDHCLIELQEGVVTFHPNEGASCFVNGVHTTQSIQLNQGALIQLGKANMFRFNYPAEAEKLKQIRKSLSTLSLSTSPVMNSSRTSLLSHSLNDLYVSNDSFAFSPGDRERNTSRRQPILCNRSINTESTWDFSKDFQKEQETLELKRQEIEELEEQLKRQQEEWQEQQCHLQETLRRKEQELSVLQDCMQIVQETISPYRPLEMALNKLEEQGQAKLQETQRIKEDLMQELEVVSADYTAVETGITLLMEQMDQLIAARQLEITAVRTESGPRFQGLQNDLEKEKSKLEVLENEVTELNSQLEEEKAGLLRQDSPVKKAYTQLTHSLHQLHHRHKQQDAEKNAKWTTTILGFQDDSGSVGNIWGNVGKKGNVNIGKQSHGNTGQSHGDTGIVLDLWRRLKGDSFVGSVTSPEDSIVDRLDIIQIGMGEESVMDNDIPDHDSESDNGNNVDNVSVSGIAHNVDNVSAFKNDNNLGNGSVLDNDNNLGVVPVFDNSNYSDSVFVSDNDHNSNLQSNNKHNQNSRTLLNGDSKNSPRSNCTKEIAKLKREQENWQKQKQKELSSLETKQKRLLEKHNKHMAVLHKQAETKQAELLARQEKCREINQLLNSLDMEVEQQVCELQEEQQVLLDLKIQKTQERANLSKEKVQKEQEIESKMTQLQGESDEEMLKIKMEKERLLDLQCRMEDDPTIDISEEVNSIVSIDSSASDILREKQLELEQKTKECEELQRKLSALEAELDAHTQRQETGHNVLLSKKLQLEQLQEQICTRALVAQEVKRRLFNEKLESEKQRRLEKEEEREESEKEIEQLKQAHEMELRLLREQLDSGNDTSSHSFYGQDGISSASRENLKRLVRQLSCGVVPSTVHVSIPHYALRGSGLFAYYEYQVKINIGVESWTVFRRYRQFRQLHDNMKKKYQNVDFLLFPQRRLFPLTEKLASQRRALLEQYLRDLIPMCQRDKNTPLHPNNHRYLTKHIMARFDPFFQRGIFEHTSLIAI